MSSYTYLIHRGDDETANLLARTGSYGVYSNTYDLVATISNDGVEATVTLVARAAPKDLIAFGNKIVKCGRAMKAAMEESKKEAKKRR